MLSTILIVNDLTKEICDDETPFYFTVRFPGISVVVCTVLNREKNNNNMTKVIPILFWYLYYILSLLFKKNGISLLKLLKEIRP